MPSQVITELPLYLQRDSSQTLPAQLAEQLRQLIITGVLESGFVLPGTRQLAVRCNVSRGTVTTAYEQLISEGYLTAAGNRTRVTAELEVLKAQDAIDYTVQPADILPNYQEKPRQELSSFSKSATQKSALCDTKAAHSAQLKLQENSQVSVPNSAQVETIDFLPGAPDSSILPSAAWRAAWRSAAMRPGKSYPPAGSPKLQVALAAHLQLTRGLRRDPQEIFISSGARSGLAQLLGALSHSAGSNRLTVAVENPGAAALHRVPAALGHRLLAIPADAQGLNPAFLPRGTAAPEVVLITPAHQYPLGGAMPLQRRLELLTWARAHGSIIIEDDYDSELRYTGEPLPALAALDAERNCVATLGTFTKLLHGGVGVGYLLAPQQLVPALSRLYSDMGALVSSITQDALAEFLHTGAARRHIAKMRREYRKRRDLIAAYLPQELLAAAGLRLVPQEGGLNAVLQFTAAPKSSSNTNYIAAEKQLTACLSAAGINVTPLDSYWAHNLKAREAQECGVVFGFAGVPIWQLQAGLERIRKVLAQQVA